MLHIIVSIILIIFAIEFIRIIVELFTFGRTKKIKCTACSGLIDSSCLSCHLCGTLQDKKWKTPHKFFLYVESLYDRKKIRVLKKTNFWNGEYSNKD